MKFYTIFLFLFSTGLSAQGLILTHEKKSKTVDIELNSEIEFKLFSDSILSIDFSDNGKIISYTDSSMILEADREILFSDFKQLTILPSNKRKAKVAASSFLIAGIAFLTRGIVMATGEGLESTNKKTAPLFIAGGALVTGIASIPFWGRKKEYNMGSGNWTLKTNYISNEVQLK